MKRAMQRAVLAGAIGATAVFTACELRPAPKPDPAATAAATAAKPTEPSGSGSGSGSENAAVAGSGSGSADAITGQAPGSGSAVTAGSGAGTGSAQPPPPPARPVDPKLVESCGKVSEHVIGILIAAAPDASKPQLEKDRARIVGRMRDGCVTGNWTEEGRKCLSMATDQAGITACEPLLQPQGG